MKTVVILSLLIPLALSGCTADQPEGNNSSGGASSTPKKITASSSRTSTPSPTASSVDPERSLPPIDGSQGEGDSLNRTKVEWSQLPAGLQEEIDSETAASNCKALDSRFMEAAGNPKLSKYLSEALILAQCQ